MCYNCGCHIKEDDMGNPENLTDQTIKRLGEKYGLDFEAMEGAVATYIKNGTTKDPNKDKDLEEVFVKAANAWGQSVEDAKKNTLKLI